MLFIGAGCFAADTSLETPLDRAKRSALEWVQLRDEAARLDSDWRSQQSLTAATVDALEARAHDLEQKRDDLKAQAEPDEKQLKSIGARIGDATKTLDESDARIRAVDGRLEQLRPSLPPRLSDSLDYAFKTLEKPNASAGERMQWTMTILGRCAAFDRGLAFAQEAVTIPGESNRRILEVIYWGLSRGYALDRPARRAWTGMPGPSGWQWQEHSEAAAAVANLIDVYNDKAPPSYSAVPVTVAHPIAGDGKAAK